MVTKIRASFTTNISISRPKIISRAIDLIQKKNKFPAIVSGKVNRSRNEKTIGFAADHVLTYIADNMGEFVEADGIFML